MIVAAVAGAIIGDTVGYPSVGAGGGGYSGSRRRAAAPPPDHEALESAQAYVRRRGGAAVSSTVHRRLDDGPGLAGMAEVPTAGSRSNAAGGLLWGTGFALLGYFAGAAWHRVAADASRVGLALLVLVLVGLVTGASFGTSATWGAAPGSPRQHRSVARAEQVPATVGDSRRIDRLARDSFTASS